MHMSAFEIETRLRYTAIRELIANAELISVLHIGSDHTGIAVGNGIDPQSTLALAIGAHRTAHEHFKRSLPSPLELENAIVVVENELTRARTLVPNTSILFTTDAVVREIAMLSGVTNGERMELSIDTLERTFDRLTSIVLGIPASHDELPASNTFAAALLILREFMHHLQFSSITALNAKTK